MGILRCAFALGVVVVASSSRVSYASPTCSTASANFVVDNTTCQLSGIWTFDTVTIKNNGVLEVAPYDGAASHVATGNLELRANKITVEVGSKITAKGAGYKTLLCGNGAGPSTSPASGGRGGCSVKDSGGGGAHFGLGGRGTIDGPTQFPRDYEQDCSAPPNATTPSLGGGTVLNPGPNGVTVTYAGVAPNIVATCHTGNGAAIPNTDGNTQNDCNFGGHDNLPTIAGQPYVHSIYFPEFGASGGDKGCLDGDGTDPTDNSPATDLGIMVAGNGGGRIVLAANVRTATLTATPTITIDGTVEANGKRGCGIGNDSGGGGAGGSILIAGEQVNIGATAVVSAAGGLGGDTQGFATDPTGECVAPAQQGQPADDCGGGGGGGIVSVLSINAMIHDEAIFSVNGAAGGVSNTCRGEAGGGVGELSISNSYVGEYCDGFDNDFDSQTDEGLGDLMCPGVMGTVPACMGGIPNQCPADVPLCRGPVTDSRARFTVIVDTSGSMLGTIDGKPTFGDGSTGNSNLHAGRDFDGNGKADDSRLFKAKAALTSVIAGYPDIDFALARYHQDQLLNRSCQTAHNFECNSICCSYDNPAGNTGPPLMMPYCAVDGGTSGPIDVHFDSAGDECINYAGTCGPPRRGADVLVGFGSDINNYLMWLDGHEDNFVNTTVPGAFCNFGTGGDCELRGTGPTPLANSLQAVDDYLTPIKACDTASFLGCRKYGVILLTDGAESCQGDPVAAATALQAKGIKTYVIGFSTLPGEAAQLNAIATAGGTSPAFVATDENSLANQLAAIVSGSVVFETCNDVDDDCDIKIDEGFVKGAACDNGQQGQCRRTGMTVCRGDHSGTVCDAAPVTPGNEGTVCNNLDDDCDGKIDEGIVGCNCIPQGETCNNMDDDCDHKIDEGPIQRACGTGVCQGVETCAAGVFSGCTATPATTETCNGADDDCDGIIDGITEACSDLAGPFPVGDPRNNPGNNPGTQPGCLAEGPAICVCHPGTRTCPSDGSAMFQACTGEGKPKTEICNALDDDCDGTVDEDTDNQDCSSNCGVGHTVCTNGNLSCTSVTTTTDDTCDGVDDDCDNKIDEDYVSPGACDVGVLCNAVYECIGGDQMCIGEVINPTETCNCDDDDCDTKVDEDVTCGAGAQCKNCQCAFACDPTQEFSCPLGKRCEAGFCLEDQCFGVDCPVVAGDKQICIPQGMTGHACVSACSQVNCTNGTRCQPATGECLPDTCTSFPDHCATSENCINGVCVANPCANVTCDADKYCVAGVCHASCEGVECGDTQRCELGVCVDDPCGMKCPAGRVCHDDTGTCGPNPCSGVICPGGQWCDPHGDGGCTDDPCVGTSCPGTGQMCVGGTCDTAVDPTHPDAGEEEHITTGGGGGCDVGGDPSGLILVLGLLAFGIPARRGRARRPAPRCPGGAGRARRISRRRLS